MSITSFTSDEYDALQEIVNIAMGQASTALSTILMSAVVRISVPRVTVVEAGQLIKVMSETTEKKEEINAIQQAFYGYLNGEVVAIYDLAGYRNVADLMGYDNQLTKAEEQELLLDASNILIGACLNGIAQQLDTELSFSAPSIMGEKVPVEALFASYDLTWNYVLLINVKVWIEDRKFSNHIFIFMQEQSIELVRMALERLLEGL